MMGKLAVKILTFVIGSLIVEGIVFCASNKIEGKTIIGKKIPIKKKTHFDPWTGNIILGTDDFEIKEA